MHHNEIELRESELQFTLSQVLKEGLDITLKHSDTPIKFCFNPIIIITVKCFLDVFWHVQLENWGTTGLARNGTVVGV